MTVRQLLSHEAGLVCLDEPLRVEDMKDLDKVSRALASQKPAWEPGTRHGYHAMTIGLYMQELIRHVDPRHRTLGRFFQDEIAMPLGIEFYIGLPIEIPDRRLAKLRTFTPLRSLAAFRKAPPGFVLRVMVPGTLLRKSMLFADLDFNDRRALEVEIPAGNGVGTARSIARAYSAFAEGGAELGLTPETLASLEAPHEVDDPRDAVMGVPSYLSLGFLKPGLELGFGTSQRAFGTPGRRRLIRLRRPRRAARLRLRDEQPGLLPVRRPAREGAARRRAPRDPAARPRMSRRRRICGCAAALFVVSVVAPAAAGQAASGKGTVAITGTAYSFDNQHPIAGATIRARGAPGATATSRANGSYRLDVPDRRKVTPYI